MLQYAVFCVHLRFGLAVNCPFFSALALFACIRLLLRRSSLHFSCSPEHAKNIKNELLMEWEEKKSSACYVIGNMINNMNYNFSKASIRTSRFAIFRFVISLHVSQSSLLSQTNRMYKVYNVCQSNFNTDLTTISLRVVEQANKMRCN